MNTEYTINCMEMGWDVNAIVICNREPRNDAEWQMVSNWAVEEFGSAIDHATGETVERPLERGRYTFDDSALIEDAMLNGVMTASEIAAEFDTTERNVRMAAERGAVRGRKSGSTWLILRSDAERMWARRSGLITAADARRMLEKTAYRVYDTSGPNQRGYEYSIYRVEQITDPIRYESKVGEPVLVSTWVHFTDKLNKKGEHGAYAAVFNLDDIKNLE